MSMKTPREILFARHRSAAPKLDSIRQEVIARTIKTNHRPETGFWRELIWPNPKAWAGITATWLLILALKLSTHDQPSTAGGFVPSSPEQLAKVRQQKILFSELAGAAQARDAEAPKSLPAGPRSHRGNRMTEV